MTIPTPSLQTARDNFWARMVANIPELQNASEQSNARALSDTIAGAIHQTRAAIPALAQAAHPATATGDYLTSWAQTYALERRENEKDDDLRARLHARIRNQTSIGTIADWRYWASLLPEVTRAKVTATHGEIAVGIWYDDRANGAPTAADLAAATTFLTAYLPAGAELRLYGMTAVTLNITLSGLTPDTTNDRQNATDAIADILRSTQLAGDTVKLSTLYQALALAGVTASITAPAGDSSPANATDIYAPVVAFTA